MPTLNDRAVRCLRIAVAAILAACDRDSPKRSIVPGGDADRGRLAITRYGCGACHVIPGVRDARGLVGPPLGGFGGRVYIAGVLPNDPRNLVRWVMDPLAVKPRTSMPFLNVSEHDARDIAEYLYK